MLNNSVAFFILWCFSFGAASEIVLITGASKGTGLKIAEALVADQTHHYVVYAGIRPTSRRSGVNMLLAKYPTRMRVVDLDLMDDDSVRRAVQTIVSRERRIDTVINYAGPFAARLEAIVPNMRAQKSGRILQIMTGVSIKNRIITESIAAQLRPSNVSLELIETNPTQERPEEVAARIKIKLEEQA